MVTRSLFFVLTMGRGLDNSIKPRAFGISDVPFLCEGLRDKEILAFSGLSKPVFLSWLSLWWWIKKTFKIVYCIECDSKRIGFIGLYDLSLGKSAEMTLVIFDKNIRRHGYGGRAFRIFSRNLKKISLIERIIVRVKTDNSISASFWQKLGFRELHVANGIKTMFIDLNG
jgi:RimJ/RimL family protein N-acetyltransferase